MLKEKSLLWTVEDPQSNTLSYLYGTMHVQSRVAYLYVEGLKPIIKSKPNFYSETDLDDLANHSRGQSSFLISDGQSLSSLISEKRYAKWISTVRKHFNMNLRYFDRTLPFVTTQYLQSHYMTTDHQLPLDKYLWEYARGAQRVLGGIESVDFQVNVLKQISLKTQIKMLKDFLSNPNKYKKQIEVLSHAYQSQNIYKLHQISKASLGGLRRLMLRDRNRRMADFIYANKGTPSFYTFGAAHLAGTDGVLPLLKRSGLKVNAADLTEVIA